MALTERFAKTESVSPDRNPAQDFGDNLRDAFGVSFAVIDSDTGQVVYNEGCPFDGDWNLVGELARQVSCSGKSEIIAEEGPLVLLAIPQVDQSGVPYSAIAPFVSRAAVTDEDFAAAARWMGSERSATEKWIVDSTPWTPEQLLSFAKVFVDKMSAETQNLRLRGEVVALSDSMATTYEEISLLYRVTQNLKLNDSEDQLGGMVLEWLADAVPVKGLALFLSSQNKKHSFGPGLASEPTYVTFGECPLDQKAFQGMINSLGIEVRKRPFVVNRSTTETESWRYPEIDEMIVVPLAEGDKLFGLLAAFNHTEGGHLGTIEASLLNSVGTILGIHSGNVALYQQRSELVGGIVRALTSAIDAKDPYTYGHSDRVARVAVRLAEELGCPQETLNTLYLAGQVHDIGKIGIDDSVLRKPGKLTNAEYEHIQLHPELGYKILVGLKEFESVLPVVLHHHENWNGQGYPHGLSGEGIPWLARITAVADAFDAMGSDRPYRKGMPDEKLDQILREDKSNQWDPRVIEAFFSAREDIRAISRQECETLNFDPKHWT